MALVRKIDHIGIAVRDLNESLKVYEEVLGLTTRVQEMKDYDVLLAFIEVGDVLVELIQSTKPDGVFAKFVQEKGEGLHHIAYEVDDIESALKSVKEKGIKMIDEQPRKGADGLIAFAHQESMSGVLVEFVEKPSTSTPP